jgi:putative transposase
LPDYDYSSLGYYFVTLCVKNKECVFGEIIKGEMALNEWGNITRDEWLKTSIMRPNVKLDEYIIMPNHFHAIFHIVPRRGVLNTPQTENSPQTVPQSGRIQSARGRIQYAPTDALRCQSPSQTVGAIIRGFKSAVTSRVRGLSQNPFAIIWQRNYYEHVIRDEAELNRTRQYILDNPTSWDLDEENPHHIV